MKAQRIFNIKQSGKKAEITISGIIGYPSWMQTEEEENVATKEELDFQLKELENISANTEQIVLNINSPGGSVYHALSMFYALDNHKAEKFVKYTGESASAATIIAAVAPKENISIPEYMSLLVHEARLGYSEASTASELEREAEDLRKTNNAIATIYSRLNGKTVSENLSLMAEDSGEGRLMTAKEAKELGFVGKVEKLKGHIQNFDEKKLIGYSEKHINQIKLNYNKMGGISFFKKEPLQTVNTEAGTLAFRIKDLKQGGEVELLNSEQEFSGEFAFAGKKITVENNKIQNIVEVSETEERYNELLKRFDALAAKLEELEKNVAVSFVESANAIAENEKILAAAKLSKSNPELPVSEFRQEQPQRQESFFNRAYEIQKKMEAKAAEKQKQRETLIGGN